MGRSFSSCRRLRRQTRAGTGILAATAVLTSTGAEPAHAQVVDLDLRNTVFYEPSGESDMTVLNPRIGLAVQPTEGFSVSAAYEADIVSGATEPTKAGPLSPDIISQASISDHRHVATGGIQIERKYARLGVSYSYGTENDYRSQAITVVGATDFLQRNTTLQLSYTRGFDEVCNVAYAKRPGADPATAARQLRGLLHERPESADAGHRSGHLSARLDSGVDAPSSRRSSSSRTGCRTAFSATPIARS